MSNKVGDASDIESSHEIKPDSSSKWPVLKFLLGFLALGAFLGAGIGIGFAIWGDECSSCDSIEATTGLPDKTDPAIETTIAPTSTTESPVQTIEFEVDQLGTLVGLVENQDVTVTRINQQSVVKFLNIPFAEPLTAQDRFTKSRVKSLPLAGDGESYDATKNGLSCPTNDPNQWTTNGYGEDCLHLNIYIPETKMSALMSGEQTPPLPVLIWIHGGAFFIGSNADGPDDDNSETNKDDPSFFVTEHDVIVVKVNYRTGPLGFLASDKPDADGYQANWGILDQTLAMEWVQDHIEKFGGDLEKRSLSGCSAGGQSVYIHLTEEGAGSEDLFKQAIVCAAPTGIPWFRLDQALGFAEKLSDGLACDNFDCLRQLPLENLLEGMWSENLLMGGPWKESLSYGAVTQMAEPYSPVIDGKVVTDQTYNRIRQGAIHKKTIIEYSTNEGEQFVTQVFGNANNYIEPIVPKGQFHTLIKFMFNREVDLECSKPEANKPNCTILESFLNTIPQPDDYDRCNVVGSDCFSYLTDNTTLGAVVGCSTKENSDDECRDEADTFLTSYSWVCPTRHALSLWPSSDHTGLENIYELELKTVHPSAQALHRNNQRCYELSCHCVGPYYWFGNYAYWKDKQIDGPEQEAYGTNLRKIYREFFYEEPTGLKSVKEFHENPTDYQTVNMLNIDKALNSSYLTFEKTFEHCQQLDSMDYYGRV